MPPETHSLKPDVQVLLATFNGETYLEQQISSLMAQDWPRFTILVRDDGSSDGTLDILRKWQVEGAPLHILTAKTRGGPMRNFGHLMQASTAPYVAFCDQDDLWDVDKLSLSMERMLTLEQVLSVDTPALVFSDVRLIDMRGDLVSPSLWNTARVHPQKASFGQMLAQNLVTGCSALANRSLLKLALPLPEQAMMHDYWLALLATAFGIASPLDRVTMSYRQHASNAVGAGKSMGLLKRLKRVVVDPDTAIWLASAARQSQAFLERYSNQLLPDQQDKLEAVIGLARRHGLSRSLYSVRRGIIRTDICNELQFFLRLTFGRNGT